MMSDHPDTPSRAAATVGSLDAEWRAAEAALPQKNSNGKYPEDGRFIYLYGPIASGVYWAHARLFDGNKADRERRNGTEPSGFAPVGAGPAAALRALTERLAALATEKPDEETA